MTELTPLAVASLALLSERPMHPYEMYQTLIQRAEDRILKVRPGSLYHTVDRMQRDGYVTAVGVNREGNRPERTTYEITETGELALAERLTELLAQPAEEYPIFPLALSEAQHLSPAFVSELMTRRLHALRARLSYLDAGLVDVRAKNLPEAYWFDLTYEHDVLGAEIRWIERFVARLDAGELDWDALAREKAHATT